MPYPGGEDKPFGFVHRDSIRSSAVSTRSLPDFLAQGIAKAGWATRIVTSTPRLSAWTSLRTPPHMTLDTAPREEADEPPPLASAEPIAVVAPRTPLRARRWVPRTAPVVGHPGDLSTHAWRFRARDIQLPHALQHEPFRRYWSGQMVALFGLWNQNTAAQLVILSLTSSAFLIGLLNIVSAIPLLLLTLVGGVVADRFERRKILMTTQLMLAGLSVAWAFLILTDAIEYWHVVILAVLGGTIASFDLPASQSFFAQIVRREDLPEAIAITSASVNATRTIGPAIAGVIIGIVGTGIAFLSHSLSLVVFVLVIASLRTLVPAHQRSAAHRGGGIEALKVGIRHIRQRDDLTGLVCTTAIFSFFAVPTLLVLLPLYMTRTLGGGDGWVPATTSVYGLGSLFAALTMFRASKREAAAGKRLRFAAFGIAGSLAWLAFAPSPWIAIPGVLLAGFSFEMGLVQIGTRMQQLAPDDIRGRVLSVNGLAFNGMMPFSTLTISAVSSLIGLNVVMLICGGGLAAGSMWLWRRYTWQAFVTPSA